MALAVKGSLGAWEINLQENIGSGAQADVFIARNVGSPAVPRVAKRYPKGYVGDSSFRREQKALCAMNHANVVKLLDTAEDESHNYLIQEYVQGHEDITTYLNRIGHLVVPDRLRFIFSQMVLAVDACHSSGIYNRDIKLDNFVIENSTGRVVLVDFGLSFVDEAHPRAAPVFFRNHCGSPLYAAPEVLDTRRSYAAAPSEMWSLGVILYVLMVGNLPFDNVNHRRLYWMMRTMKPVIPSTLIDYPSSIKSLALKLLSRDPAARPTLVEILSDPWLFPNVRFRTNFVPTMIGHCTTHVYVCLVWKDRIALTFRPNKPRNKLFLPDQVSDSLIADPTDIVKSTFGFCGKVSDTAYMGCSYFDSLVRSHKSDASYLNRHIVCSYKLECLDQTLPVLRDGNFYSLDNIDFVNCAMGCSHQFNIVQKTLTRK